jgi:hypothetical protein
MGKYWEEFKEDEPGRRFLDRYDRNQLRAKGRFDVRRLLNVIAGTLLVLVSVFFGWAPGPGMLTLAIGLGMISSEFRPVAVFLDWLELRLRELWWIVRPIWDNASPGERALIVLALAACVAALVSLVFYLL